MIYVSVNARGLLSCGALLTAKVEKDAHVRRQSDVRRNLKKMLEEEKMRCMYENSTNFTTNVNSRHTPWEIAVQ